MSIFPKQHIPCIFIALSLVAGISLSCLNHKVSLIIIACLFIVTAFFKVFGKDLASRNFLVLVLFVSAGTISMLNKSVLSTNDILNVSKYYRGKTAEVRGIVNSSVVESRFFSSTKRSFVLKIHSVKAPWGWDEKSGDVLVNLFNDSEIKYGDEIIICGKLHLPYEFEGKGRFSYIQYLKQKGINLILSVKKENQIRVLSSGNGNPLQAVAIKVTSALQERFYKNLTFNEAAIMSAILLGDRSKIPKHIKELFVRTGTVHILAISGLHTGIIAGIFLIFLNLLPCKRKTKMIFVCVLIVAYCFCTGSRPSVMRASFMIIVILLGYVFEKNPDPLNTLSLSALLILFYDPRYLFNIGFQLSYICVLSIILFSNKIDHILEEYFNKGNFLYMRFILNALSVSFSIWVGVSGMIAYYFQIITPISIIANLFVVPVLSLVVVNGFILLLFSFCSASLTYLSALCLKILLNLMAGGIFLLDKVPMSYISLSDINLWYVIAYYFMVFVLCVAFLFIMTRKTHGVIKQLNY